MSREYDQTARTYGINKTEYDQLAETFRMEALELLSELEVSLLELEKYPNDGEAVSSIFRAFHTLKGSGAMAGFDDVSQFTHNIETVYDLVRKGETPVDGTLIDLTLKACDLIREMIVSPKSVQAKACDRKEEILASLRKLVPESTANKKLQDKSGQHGKEPVREKQITYRICFRPSKKIFLDGTNPLLLLNELRGLGECIVVIHNDEIPEIYTINPEACYTSWDAILTTNRGIDAIKDVFIFVEGESEIRIDVIEDGEHSFDMDEYRKIGEILLDKSDIDREDLQRALTGRKRLGEVLVEEGIVSPMKIEAALVEQEKVRQILKNRQKSEAISNIRVSSLKLDLLVNLVGELVTIQARLSQTSSNRIDPELVSIAEEVERLTGELREITMEMRMLPVGTTFSAFKRLVRDLSRELDKEVELITDGGETELDKTVIEKLNDPLMHLIRNSIDHGIELPKKREETGKKREGTIHLVAEHSGDHVRITIMDDGAGLDKDIIRAKAVEKGMIPPDAELTDKEIFSLIFSPGFTTSDSVTSVSGRGVGMDVVKRAVDFLGGSIAISSGKGAGTTISLNLPLTLAIIEGFLIKIAEEYFVLPLLLVEECVELTAKDSGQTRGMHLANVRGHIVPYVRLREKLKIEGIAPPVEQIVIINFNNTKVGLVADHVIGGYQTVIKNLGKFFRDIEGISGATILGDGTVALILDVPKLIEISEREEVIMAFAKSYLL
jgi:two-component system, chemotaxis family, sensor kinase CheA